MGQQTNKHFIFVTNWVATHQHKENKVGLDMEWIHSDLPNVPYS